MAVGYSAPEDVINAALREVGYPRPVAEIYEGSRASRVAIEVYGPARDALLLSQDWDFAYREAPLTLSTGAPVAGFGYSYIYPADCLRIRYIRLPAVPIPNNDPRPVRWLTYNDQNLEPPGKLIACGIAAATICYIAQITDPSTWNPVFSRAMVRTLAEIFAFALRDEINLSRTRALMADQATAEAASVGDAMSPPEIPRGGGQRGGQPQG